MAMSSSNENAAEPDVDAAAVDSTSKLSSLPAPTKQVNDQVPLTYLGSINSSAYKCGWECLQAGAFDEGLEAAEMGLEETKARIMDLLQQQQQQSSPTAVLAEDVAEFHEAMAPFNYLYGTTLLYSVEEQTSEQLAALTMAETAPAVAAEASSGNNSDASEASAAAAVEQVKEEYADDLEIAWDNLEMARTILEKMLHEAETSEQTVKKEKIQLDLAQVCLRAGDLQRINGLYEAAIRDFERSLQLRMETPLLGPYDRQIADVLMNIGGTYFLLISTTKTTHAENPMLCTDPQELEKKLVLWRSRGFYNNFMAGQTLCGQLAIMSGVNPNEFFHKAERKVPGFKTTGLEKHEEEMEHPTTLSLKLVSLREHAGKLEPLCGQQDLFAVIIDLLDEIQESIDEGKAGEEGVEKVHQMKAEITAAIAGQHELEDELAITGEATTIGFGSAAAAATTATAQPIAATMVKKKKKKREDPAEGAEANPPAKQLKTETE